MSAATRDAFITAVSADPRWPATAARIAALIGDDVDATDPDDVFYWLYVTGEYLDDEESVDTPRVVACWNLRWDGDWTAEQVGEWYETAARFLADAEGESDVR